VVTGGRHGSAGIRSLIGSQELAVANKSDKLSPPPASISSTAWGMQPAGALAGAVPVPTLTDASSSPTHVPLNRMALSFLADVRTGSSSSSSTGDTDRIALSFLTDEHTGTSCSSRTADTDAVAPVASFSEPEEDQTTVEGLRQPAPLHAASMDRIECYLTHASMLSYGDGSLQCEFIVHSNFQRQCHSDDRANCSLCGQRKAALAHDLPILVEGRADPHRLVEGATAMSAYCMALRIARTAQMMSTSLP